MNLTDPIGKAIEFYTGDKLATLLVHEDAEVAGTFAFRATFTKGRSIDFLTVGVPLATVTHNDLEECAFSVWPPKGRISDWMED